MILAIVVFLRKVTGNFYGYVSRRLQFHTRKRVFCAELWAFLRFQKNVLPFKFVLVMFSFDCYKSVWEQHRTTHAPADQPLPPLWIDGIVPIRVKSQLLTLPR